MTSMNISVVVAPECDNGCKLEPLKVSAAMLKNPYGDEMTTAIVSFVHQFRGKRRPLNVEDKSVQYDIEHPCHQGDITAATTAVAHVLHMSIGIMEGR